VVNATNQEIARGLIAYSSHDTTIIRGHKSEAFTRLLGYAGHDELIHRDDLVLL
jgi:glutamate 5-kinase